uniref:C-type lectin domain-containing protein n=1 Tax=Amphiprion percula TaxID=161767 RepID=A0A3P8RNM4_AMPPE
MEIDDDTYIALTVTCCLTCGLIDFYRSKRPSRCVTVCLGLLCAVLLAGNLQRSFRSLATYRDQLQKKVDKMTAKVNDMLCQENWTKFETSCYFVSTVKKNWTESRQACIAEGADLVVIDSRKEQAFVNGILDARQNAWIGLTDSVQEGVWKWVDGTSVTTTYWQPGQPNSYNRNQDCGEFVQESSLGQWNDDGCFADQVWICEK